MELDSQLKRPRKSNPRKLKGCLDAIWERLRRRPIGQAVTERGLFASQVTACKLRDERTIEVVLDAFGLNGESGVSATEGSSA